MALKVALVVALSSVVVAGAEWPMIGRDPANSRNQPNEHTIGVANVARLVPKWVAPMASDVSATPAVVDDAVYVGDLGGMLWKLDAKTGRVIWSKKVAEYTGIDGDIARTSPIVAGNTLIVGDLRHPNVLAIDTRTGALLWKTQVHPDARGIMTGSAVLSGNTIYTGVSATGANGANSTFRGAVVALDLRTGKIVWRTYSLPDNGDTPGGYAGATMFAPPSIDEEAGLVYGTFGQQYHEPASVTACHAEHGGFTESCERPGAFFRSIVAFDLKTGAPKWSYRMLGHDPWQRACGHQPAAVTWCAAETENEKWDFGGSGANVMRLRIDGRERDVVGVGSKSGVYVLLDARSGAFIWNTLLGPGGDQGGMEWGTAFDGARIYASITNQHHLPYRMTNGGTLGATSFTGGSWAALDAVTGRILWQVADTQTEILPDLGTVGVWDLAPATVANGVVYVASMAKQPTDHQMFALDARTGATLWQFSAGSSVNAGPAIVDGVLYWGSGYARNGAEGSEGHTLFAFSVDGR